MIKLEKISKSFKNIKLFDNLNFTFEDGNIYMITGPNGCGKSILLKIISGFSKPDVGTVIVNDYQIYKDSDFIINTGISINSDEFIPYLSGFENLKILIDINKKVPVNDICKYAKLFNLDEQVLKKPYKTYSQGMKQKMRLIQAMIEKPQYLILDEPTNALDADAIKTLKKLLLDFMVNKKHMVILVSHSNDEISEIADVVLNISNYSISYSNK